MSGTRLDLSRLGHHLNGAASRRRSLYLVYKKENVCFSSSVIPRRSNRMAFKILVLAALMATAFARPDRAPAYGYGAPTPAYAPAKYDFNYAVNDPPSGNDFGHQESRDGDLTQGSYYVLLPDGRLQRVTYNVNGDSGYLAEVTYEGEAQYPTQQRAYTPAPVYG
ncbi:cuticle protein 7-like [Penaeus indicus]|uniref:cuticle protein 7-like n=1 Tax=Penaeus indicus TaxID=29960 RepID=UPI00300CC705